MLFSSEALSSQYIINLFFSHFRRHMHICYSSFLAVQEGKRSVFFVLQTSPLIKPEKIYGYPITTRERERDEEKEENRRQCQRQISKEIDFIQAIEIETSKHQCLNYGVLP